MCDFTITHFVCTKYSSLYIEYNICHVFERLLIQRKYDKTNISHQLALVGTLGYSVIVLNEMDDN